MVENWKKFTDLGSRIAVTGLDVRLPVDGQNGAKEIYWCSSRWT